MKALTRLQVLVFLACASLAIHAQVVLDIDAGKRGATIGDRHYGIFFEEINHAGDGGLYAELIHNRSFEDNAANPDNWQKVGGATMALTTKGMMNEAQTLALNLKFLSAGDGVRNNGFWGINAVNGRTYKLNFWAKSDAGYNGTLTARLETEAGVSLGQTAIPVTLNGEWKKVTAELTATGNDAKAWFSLTSSVAGDICLDVVSLFPPTYKNRENGCRIDLAEKLEAMNPAFVRFPGGCYVEGHWANGKTNRFEWKNTIGPIERRPGHRNNNWNYNVSDGLGFHEMLQLTEDLGAEPLFVVNMGMGHGWMVDYTEIGEYIQEALDAIEYCNGDVTTTWGAKRAANGHPEPFNLQLIEIGNENYNYNFDNNSDQSDHYAERYYQFYQAIRAKYPDMVIIGNVEAWSTDNPTWRNSYPVDVVDEHYYRSPAWFVNQYSKYDAYDRSRPKVYAGEYAVTQDFGTTGHLRAALGEAVYMLGMENNSDMCVMNSYAPIFVNENDQNWKPDMIRFNSSESFGTPSYYVQQLFPNNVGKQNVKWTETNNEMRKEGSLFGLSTWKTAATFDNVKVTDANGAILFTDDFSTDKEVWSYSGGTWSVGNGVLSQTSTSMEGKIYLCSVDAGENYTLEVDATKTSGAEGFLIAFNYQDANNYCWWNLGGWANTAHGVEVCTNGSKSTVANRSGSLVTGQTYHLKIEVAGASVKCYMDNNLMHEFTLPVQRKVYVSSNIDDEGGMLYVKIVNPNNVEAPAVINLKNATLKSGELILMTSASSEDENTVDNPNKVCPSPATQLTGIVGNTITYTIPANSLNILRLSVTDITTSDQAGKPATTADVENFKKQIANTMSRLNYLHNRAPLPSTTAEGIAIQWMLKEDMPGYVTLQNNNYSQTLSVQTLPEGGTLKVGTLTASVTFADGSVANVDYPITLAPDDNRYGYLYCFMNSNKEITNYALGTKEDLGKRFHVLLGGGEIFNTAELARIEGGTRDAFILRGEKENQYLMATTDMCVANTGKWNNYGMDLLRSTDLIHWESTTFDFRQGKQIFSDPDATTGCYDTDEEYARINRVWAPQMIWDKSKQAYLVYYSLLSTNEGDSYDKIYYSYADPDFKTLTQPRIFFDPGFSVIDGDIVYNPYDGLYHMYYKREAANGSDRGVYEATSPSLVGDVWTDITHVTNEGTAQVEGSSTIRRINEDVYNLYYMRYSEGYVYKVCETDHVGLNTTSSTAVQGDGAFQHGSFMTVTEAEYITLQTWSDIIALLETCRQKAATSGTTLFDEAIRQAETALALTTVAELAVELPKAYQALLDADKAYQDEMFDKAEGVTDITDMITNPDFSEGSTGWEGTAFTAANGYVAEQWNKTFDNYQVLTDMPAGKYTLTCQGFYRYGTIDNAANAYLDNTEQLHAELYMNEASTPFISIFSDTENYTLSPYNYPNSVGDAQNAFNVLGTYTGNKVEVILKEPGDLKIGMRKTVYVDSDWTIFDNFKLTYEPLKLEDGVYYLRNVATGLYLVGANNWGTRASLGEPELDVTVKMLSDGKYSIDTQVSNLEGGPNLHYLGSNGYIDSPVAEWSIVTKEEGRYALTFDGVNYLGYDGVNTVLSLNLTNPDAPEAQWEVVTREDLLATLTDATADNPIEATFMIQGADFNHNDLRRNAWINATKFGGDATNECAEVWNATINIYQEIADLPNGSYRLTAQGFYRLGGGEKNNADMAADDYATGSPTLHAVLYANDVETLLPSIMAEAKDGDLPDTENYYPTYLGYVPQSMTGASAFFNEGLYTTTLSPIEVTDGTLKIGIRKETSSNLDWTIFDNFRLWYMGDETPSFIPGDVNGDDLILINDVVLTINYILGMEADNFIFSAADMDADNRILINDVVLVINALLKVEPANTLTARNIIRETFSTNETPDGFCMKLSNADDYVAMQYDVAIPEGASIDNISLTADSNHTLSFRKIREGVVRVVVTSLTNDAFASNSQFDVKVSTDKDANILLSNAYVATRDGSLVEVSDTEVLLTRGSANGIPTMDADVVPTHIYDLTGRLVKRNATSTEGLQKGIYLINKKKITIK